MSNLRLKLSAPRVATAPAQRMRLGQYLIAAGAIGPDDLLHGLALQRRIDAPLGEVLAAEGLVSPEDIVKALARQYGAQPVDLIRSPSDPRLSKQIPVTLCLKFGAVPWLELGDRLLVATGRPGDFAQLCNALGERGENLMLVVADPQHVQAQIGKLYAAELAHQAATRVPALESCRDWGTHGRIRQSATAALWLTAAALLLLFPSAVLAMALLWGAITLLMTSALKAAALWGALNHPRPPPAQPNLRDLKGFRLPRVSVLVPLLREKEIAQALIARLSRLTYPKSLLEVVLVLEASDKITRNTIERTSLPPWITVIEVPDTGVLKTKPRALNYALDFCRGSIIGVWDAEDAPEPDQIEQVVTRFQNAPKNIACLQGVLDFYNSRSNWMARCFTIEYATWWRVILPGIARLGLVVPLGGTTLFFRRDILERLGAWDAHNVTEDADLGLRLARHGYATELLPTVTFEEANCRPWPWVRQRSRWLKGYLLTWCVHMRRPRTLLNDLGLIRFLGVQATFLATFSQFVLAPLLWSLWLSYFGLYHPVTDFLSPPLMTAIFTLFILSEMLNLCASAIAVSKNGYRHLLPWVITLPLYFTLGAIAAAKALYELNRSPHYWDKTAHGHALPLGEQRKPKTHPRAGPLPASIGS
ncbi:Beta-monoglucosyldiacylglycerol synthase [Sulfitobacter sp. DSM 110093]|uniref:glycosyltransferase n=1 Tax=Sulfitobacter sp. DSM 110093 TaxID=2883127 RepID=UPI001FACA5BA|nr:glycosyltransferase [Sulfitobacter sp. DSM 110093]UOA31361.1 Beta-monoglucosyldiacylglycerol synthase [Sulfitobacter sp. DSM 110093]